MRPSNVSPVAKNRKAIAIFSSGDIGLHIFAGCFFMDQSHQQAPKNKISKR